MSRTGYSQFWTPGGSGSAEWRGLSLGSTATQSVLSGDSAAIAWDVLYADSDGIRSTGSQGPYGSGITVPTGAAGVVPAGMAGLWRLSGNLDVYLASTGTVIAFGIIVNDFSPFWEDDLSAYSGPLQTDLNLTVASLVYPLAEGDVVWCNFTNSMDDTLYVGGPDATFLMEYVGPNTTPS